MKMDRHFKSPFRFCPSQLETISNEVRKGVFEICLNAQSGHLGGSSSSVELMVALYFGGILRYDPWNPRSSLRDRVLTRGHLGPLRYKIFSLLEWVKKEELLSYRALGSRLQGHEDHLLLPGVDITPSGSLGMLLSFGVGCSIAANESRESFRTFVFLGDGEEQEGNVSEAARHAGRLRLNSLIAILDKNRKQLSGPVSETDSSNIRKIWEGYSWKVLDVDDGHDFEKIIRAYKLAIQADRPTIIIAKTIKGFELKKTKDHFSGYHTIGVCPKEIVVKGIARLQRKTPLFTIVKPRLCHAGDNPIVKSGEKKNFEFPIRIEPRKRTSRNLDACQAEYFTRLWQCLAENNFDFQTFFLTADVTRRDHVELLKLKENSKFLNVGIREQHMLAMAHGISLTDPSARIIINSFDAFLYRSLDQLNALVQGGSNVLIIGDVAGITNAKNGKTHQTVGHPGALLNMPNVIFLEPGDVRDLYNCFNKALSTNKGAYYIRIHSSNVEPFQRSVKDLRNIDNYVVYESEIDPKVVIIASGFTVSFSVQAAKELSDMRVPTRVVNVVNQKSLGKSFAKNVPEGSLLLTVYNGLPEILFGSVASAILKSGRKFFGKAISHGYHSGTSGSLPELVKHFGFDKEGIIKMVKINL